MAKSDWQWWLIVYLGFLLFLCSLPLQVCETHIPDLGVEDRVSGLDALFGGWILVFGGCPAWCANPLIVAAATFMRFEMWSKALTTASVAVVCSLTIFLFYQAIPSDRPVGNILCTGVWYWLTAIGCVWFSSLGAWIQFAEPADVTGSSFATQRTPP